MVSEYKKIVLLIGLEAINDYHFRLIKSLLAKDLKLTRNMQDDYDRIRIADLMEEKFRSDAGLRKLIAVCRDIPALADLVKTLEKRRLKVKKKSKGKKKTTVKKGQQDEPTTAPSTSPTNTDLEPESKEEIPLLKEMETTNSKTNKMKEQESQGQRQLPVLSEMGSKPSQCIFHTPQMPPTAPSSSLQTPQVHATALPSSLQTPQSRPTPPSSSLQSPQMHPKASSGRTHTTPLSLTSLRKIQTPHLSLTSCSRIQTPHMSTTKPSGRIQTPHFSPTSSREIQRLHLSLASSNGVQTPHIYPTTSSSLQTPQMPPTEPSNIIQNPQVCPAIQSTSLQTPQKTPTSFSSCLPMNPRLKTVPKEASIECGYQKGPKEVVVLKATEPFTYEFRECEKRMLHATVATESEFFRVKVFDINLKDKFIPRKVIAISDYIGRNGFLEIYSGSSVTDVSANRNMEPSPRLLHNASATPKIKYLCSQCTVKYVNGVYSVFKRTVREDCIYYEIQDNTGKMEVVVHGRLTYINCEEGDKLKLFCFELAFSADKWQLRSVRHSYIKVTKTKKIKTEPLKPNSHMDTSEESS